MNNYKLIKTYPGMPYLNSLAYFKNGYYRIDVENVTGLVVGTKEVIKENPEFWEISKIKSLKAKILKFAVSSTKLLANALAETDLYSIGSAILPLSYLLEHEKEFNIVSIMRIEDGVIFNVGAEITYVDLQDELCKSKISQFYMEDGDIVIQLEDDYEMLGDYGFETLAIFDPYMTNMVTEDGMPISINSIVYSVNLEFKLLRIRITREHDTEDRKYFHLLEAAKDYITANKPYSMYLDEQLEKQSKEFSEIFENQDYLKSLKSKDMEELFRSLFNS